LIVLELIQEVPGAVMDNELTTIILAIIAVIQAIIAYLNRRQVLQVRQSNHFTLQKVDTLLDKADRVIGLLNDEQSKKTR